MRVIDLSRGERKVMMQLANNDRRKIVRRPASHALVWGANPSVLIARSNQFRVFKAKHLVPPERYVVRHCYFPALSMQYWLGSSARRFPQPPRVFSHNIRNCFISKQLQKFWKAAEGKNPAKNFYAKIPDLQFHREFCRFELI